MFTIPAGVFAFLILKDGVDDAEKIIFEDLEKLVRKWIAAFAVPNIFLVSVNNLTLNCYTNNFLNLDCTWLAQDTFW